MKTRRICRTLIYKETSNHFEGENTDQTNHVASFPLTPEETKIAATCSRASSNLQNLISSSKVKAQLFSHTCISPSLGRQGKKMITMNNKQKMMVTCLRRQGKISNKMGSTTSTCKSPEWLGRREDFCQRIPNCGSLTI